MHVPKVTLALALGLCAMTTQTPALSPEQPVVRVECRIGTAGDDDLCRAVINAISDLATRSPVLQHNDPPEPLRPADVGITFVLDHRDAMGLAGHLEWQVGSDGPRHTGSVVRLDVMDATISPNLYQSFARSLLEVDPDLSSRLQTSF